jgi:hypothetical protein
MDDMTTLSRPLDAHVRRRIAVEAVCDARSVKNYLDGKPLRALVRTRIEMALRRLGYGGAVRAEAAS